MEKRSYFLRIPEAAGLSRRHSSYVDSILTDIAGNPVRRVRHTTGPFCKTAKQTHRCAPTRPSVVSSPSPILNHLALVVVDYSPSKPLSPVEPCRSVATRPATPRNVGSGIMQKAAAEQCAPRRCTRMEEARKRLDGRENVAPSPFIRIADSEARTTVPFFPLAFQNSVCHASKGKLFVSRDLFFSIQTRETLQLLAQLNRTRDGAIVEKSIG